MFCSSGNFSARTTPHRSKPRTLACSAIRTVSADGFIQKIVPQLGRLCSQLDRQEMPVLPAISEDRPECLSYHGGGSGEDLHALVGGSADWIQRRLLKTSNCGVLVGKNVEHSIEFCDLQKIANLLRELQQL